MKFQRLLVDGDSLLYRCGYAAKDEPIENALHNFKNQMQAIEEAVQCYVTNVYIKGEGNFRNEIAVSKPYKGNRTTPPPPNYNELKQYCLDYWKGVEVHGMEADDMCSYLLYNDRGVHSGTVLAAMDKDLWNTPGWHFNYYPTKMTLEYVDGFTADRNFIMQLLTGDASDNIPGLPLLVNPIQPLNPDESIKPLRMGPKRAAELLNNYDLKHNKDALALVWDAYKWYGMSEGWSMERIKEYFIEQGRLLWMTRKMHPDGSPVLWEPPRFLFERD